MPEITEVAVTAEALRIGIGGKMLVSVDFISGRYLNKRPKGWETFNTNLPIQITSVHSRGKFMWMKATDPWSIWITFGMSGFWCYYSSIPDDFPDHTRIAYYFEDNSVAIFCDMRNFGYLYFCNQPGELEQKRNTLYPCLLRHSLQTDKLSRYQKPIVATLMAQTQVGSGIGNYLSCEILYRAKIDPHTPSNQLSEEQKKDLVYWTKYIIKLAYLTNASSTRYQCLPKIKPNNYHKKITLTEDQFQYQVYGRKKDILGNPVKIAKIVKSGKNAKTGELTYRSTYWVPSIQSANTG